MRRTKDEPVTKLTQRNTKTKYAMNDVTEHLRRDMMDICGGLVRR